MVIFQNFLGKTSVLTWLLQETECDVTARDISGSTVAHLAARYGYLNTLRRIVEFGGDDVLTSRTNSGALPLHCAATWGHLDTLKFCVERNSRCVQQAT